MAEPKDTGNNTPTIPAVAEPKETGNDTPTVPAVAELKETGKDTPTVPVVAEPKETGKDTTTVPMSEAGVFSPKPSASVYDTAKGGSIGNLSVPQYDPDIAESIFKSPVS